MSSIIATTILMVSLAAGSFAIALPVPEFGTVPQREPSPTDDEYRLVYYNICSGWTLHWVGYCFTGFEGAPLPPMYGTCFDLADCPSDCRQLTDVWWAAYCVFSWDTVDLEIYCADDDCCPVGAPLAGVYGYWISHSQTWNRFSFEDLNLCPCDLIAGRFIVMVTDRRHNHGFSLAFPYSDASPKNIEAGCETEWRCSSHSYVYRNDVSYCGVYGVPAALWTDRLGGGCTNYPTMPPGCHSVQVPGYYCEWLIECYISCLGATGTEKASWSEIKRLYR